MDQSIISNVKNIVIQHGYSSYLVAQAKRSEGKLSSVVIISINNRCLMTFNQKGNKVTNTFSWLTLSSIKYAKPKLKFYFQKTKYTIYISDGNIVKVVSEALQKILLSRELKSIGWTALNLPIIQFSLFSAMNRILERASLQKIKLSSQTTERIFSILIYSQPEIYINDIPNISSFIDIFFESLPFFPELYNIAISKMDKFDPYSTLTNYVSYLKDLKRFEIIGPKTDSFSQFFKAFLKHQHFHLYSVSFRNSELEEKDLNIIHDFLVGRNIKGIEFHKAIKKEAMPSLFQFFFNPDLVNNLISLNISESNEIDINRLILKLNNIQVLSLAKCDIEIGDTLRKLSSLTKLRILDLSNNAFRAKVTSMPPNLTSIYLNSVSWSDQTLFYFITHLPNHYITLSMCNAQASSNEWATFYNYLPTVHGNFGIESFGFDGNRVHQNLFSFLNENNGLYSLSLNGCFAENDVDSIAALCKFVQTSRSLEKLIVRGNKNIFLGRSVDQIIASVLQSKSINYLDISDNKSGDFAINSLHQIFLTNNKLETLIFDGLCPNSASLYVDFIKKAMNRKQLELSFPLYDLMLLMSKSQITKQELIQIKDLFANKSENGTIFKKYPNYNAFPLYLRKDSVLELSDPVEQIESKPQSKSTNQNQNQNLNKSQNQIKTQNQAQNLNKNQNQQKQQNSPKQQQQKQLQQQQNQIQQQQLQQQQIQQQQIQELQQQLQEQQIKQQQLQQQLLQQMQQQSPRRAENNNNIRKSSSNTNIRNSNNNTNNIRNSSSTNNIRSTANNNNNNGIRNSSSSANKKLPLLDISQSNKSPTKGKNTSGPEPTLIINENDDNQYDENDLYKYTTYDSYFSDPPAQNNKNNSNNQNQNQAQSTRNRNRNRSSSRNNKRSIINEYNDYDYTYNDELDYSPIEEITRHRLPARPKSASRFRNEMQHPNPNQVSNRPRQQQQQQQQRTPNNARPQSARKPLRTMSQRRPQSVKRNRGTRDSTRRGNNSNSTRGSRGKGASGAQQRRPNSTRPTRSASACQMRRPNEDDDFDSYMNDSRQANNDDYYSDNNGYSDDGYEQNISRNRGGNNNNNNFSRSQRSQPKKNKSIEEYFEYEDDDYSDYFEYDDREKASPNSSKKRIVNVPLRRKKPPQQQQDEDDDSASFSSEEEKLKLKNKPMPALRGKPKPKVKQITRKTPKKNETTKPSIKEFQKQNKMKLRQAQLRQQIQLLEDEEEDSIDPNKTAETNNVETTTTTTVQSPSIRNHIFVDESNLETTYDIPTWHFPIKMKFEFDDKRTFKIEKTFSTETLIEEILKKGIPKATKVSKVFKKSLSAK